MSSARFGATAASAGGAGSWCFCGALAFPEPSSALARTSPNAIGEQTSALARSNEDLERFAHVAAHDLREPLRMVINSGQLLVCRHGAGMAAAQGLLACMLGGGQRAQEPMRDLLSLARLASPTDAV